ncbi:hypothetical protein NPIL_438641 [Nephila pilipes]|uniref:Uncharacterized protein n=1 Tax=Nephila pilipes TaxID=299642 RepID=A0A8X6MRS7_NEPPI|nr:hypothetical protein NPIL_438641 [Nephila pilipes]
MVCRTHFRDADPSIPISDWCRHKNLFRMSIHSSHVVFHRKRDAANTTEVNLKMYCIPMDCSLSLTSVLHSILHFNQTPYSPSDQMQTLDPLRLITLSQSDTIHLTYCRHHFKLNSGGLSTP